MRRALADKKTLVFLACGIGALLIIAIGAVLYQLLKNDTAPNIVSTEGTSEGKSLNAGSSGSLRDGRVSDLSGGVASYRNLKGLTLRINQIDTCNPEVLSAYISVSSDEGTVNTNFGKNDVSVYLDGEKISDFQFSTVDTAQLPLSNILLIDHSGSMDENAMKNAKDAARQYINNLKKGDQVGVIQFDHMVEKLVPVTTDKNRAANSIAAITPRGDTAIFDALSTGIDEVPDCGRKAVTVLTDGEDTASTSSSQKSIIEKSTRENLPVFAVGIKSPNFDPSAIRAIAEKSGGQYLEANTPSQVRALYEKIDSQLTGQFVANFRVNIDKNGKKHTLKIISNVEGSETGSERVFVF